MYVLPGRAPGRSLHDVGSCGYGGSPELSLQAKALRVRKPSGDVVDLDDQVVCRREYPELAVVAAHTSRIA